MTLGSTPKPNRPPSMVRAGVSALALLASIVLLAKPVMVAPKSETNLSPSPAADRQPRTASRPAVERTSNWRIVVPIGPLRGYRRGEARFRTVSDDRNKPTDGSPDEKATDKNTDKNTVRPIHIASEIDGLAYPTDKISTIEDARCGGEHVIHQLIPVEGDDPGGSAEPALPPEFEISGGDVSKSPRAAAKAKASSKVRASSRNRLPTQNGPAGAL